MIEESRIKSSYLIDRNPMKLGLKLGEFLLLPQILNASSMEVFGERE